MIFAETYDRWLAVASILGTSLITIVGTIVKGMTDAKIKRNEERYATDIAKLKSDSAAEIALLKSEHEIRIVRLENTITNLRNMGNIPHSAIPPHEVAEIKEAIEEVPDKTVTKMRE